MPSHRRIKDVGPSDQFDDDDDYDDRDGYSAPADADLSVADEQQLAAAVTLAKDLLGPVAAAAVPSRLIRDFVWDAYFDPIEAVEQLKQDRRVKAVIGRAVRAGPGKAGAGAGKGTAAKGTAAKGTAAKPGGGAQSAIAKATAEVSRLEITPGSAKSGGSTPTAKTPTIDVVAAWKKEQATGKRRASFVVIGHVDHGKSTLMGQLLVSVGAVAESAARTARKTAEGLNKPSFGLAFLLDSTADERERGITVDVATRHFDSDSTSFTILDAPGHRDFVPNMIAGTAQADFAVLVVDCQTSAFDAGFRGQTGEHAIIARSASGAASQIVVAVNKMDAVGWQAEPFHQVCDQLEGFLVRIGYSTDRITFVPVSALKGDNIAGPTHAQPDRSWYRGPTLIEALDRCAQKVGPTVDSVSGPVRIEVVDLLGSNNTAVSLAGRIVAGSVQVGDRVVVAGTAADSPEADVLSLELVAGPAGSAGPRSWAAAGDHIRLRLGAIGPEAVATGDILVRPPQSSVLVQSRLKVRLLALEPIVPGPVDVFVGVRALDGIVARLVGIVDVRAVKAGAADRQYSKMGPKLVPAGATADVEIALVAAGGVAGPTVWVDQGRRVVVRRDGQTVAIGLMTVA